jgi:hypothetical protein
MTTPVARARTRVSSAAPQASQEARRLAAIILEVLAGLRSVAEAAAAVGLSLPRYYAAELRALHGLLAACEPRPRRRQASPQTQLAQLQKQHQQLQRQCDRQQALLRLAQRGIGLAPAAPRGKAAAGQPVKKRRRPQRRVLKVIEQLRATGPDGAQRPCAAENDVP